MMLVFHMRHTYSLHHALKFTRDPRPQQRHAHQLDEHAERAEHVAGDAGDASDPGAAGRWLPL